MTNITAYDALEKRELPPAPERSDSSTGVYLHSGGTGGEPKIIELSDSAVNALGNRGLEALCTDDARACTCWALCPCSTVSVLQ